MRAARLPSPNQLALDLAPRPAFDWRRIAQPPTAMKRPRLYEDRRRAALLALGWAAHVLDAALAVETVAAAWALWMSECRGRGLARGCWLVELLSDPDNVGHADDLLRAAEARGELVRGAFEPSPSLGILNFGRCLTKKAPDLEERRRFYASMWNWMVTR